MRTIAHLLFLSLLSAFAAAPRARSELERIVIPVASLDDQGSGRPMLDLPLQFPGEAEVRLLRGERAWTDLAALAVEVTLPAGAPEDVQVLVTLKDWDGYWYQQLAAKPLEAGRRATRYIDLSSGSSAWTTSNHHSAWNLRALMAPELIRLRLFSATTWEGQARIEAVQGLVKAAPDTPPTIRNMTIANDVVPTFGKYEMTFDLPDRYTDPYDAEQILVQADVTGPDGLAMTVDGYYTRRFFRVMDATGERAVPQGRPRWQVRICPTRPGAYSVRLRARDAVGETVWGPVRFHASESQAPGFIRVSKQDPRFFEFDDGSPFFLIGHNIRSPFDTRSDGRFPWMRRWPEGPAAYRRYFRKMRDHGENIAEIWTAAWSLGLEWSPRSTGYRGIGQYNLLHAWQLDRVFEDAEAFDIYINLVIHNHGKFSDWSDEEWEHNPFNTANGGYLNKPEEYFSDPRALESFRKLMRYMVSRWGYSRRLFAWELWSELDLTGSRAAGRRNHFSPDVVQWHETMGRYLKEIDPYDHNVSTHVCGDYTHQNPAIISLPEMDLCPVDAYHGNQNPLHIVDLMRRTAAFNNPYGKPVQITEFGGSAGAQQGIQHLDHTLHAALWASSCIPVAGTPFLWWWMVIEEENLFPKFLALSRFMEGEDRRDPNFLPLQPVVRYGANAEDVERVAVAAQCMKNTRRALGWIHVTDTFDTVDPAGEPTVHRLELVLEGMAHETYEVEFWETLTGTIIAREVVEEEQTRLTIPVPPFARDLAFKVRVQESKLAETQP